VTEDMKCKIQMISCGLLLLVASSAVANTYKAYNSVCKAQETRTCWLTENCTVTYTEGLVADCIADPSYHPWQERREIQAYCTWWITHSSGTPAPQKVEMLSSGHDCFTRCGTP
jgi:hypothetical protein